MMDQPLRGIRLMLPVKPFHLAKSRLNLSTTERYAVAERLFLHTLGVAVTAIGPENVFVVSSDSGAERGARDIGVDTLPDPDLDLNFSLDAGMRTLRRRFPSDTVAVLVVDLPCLRPPMLRRLLLDCSSSTQARHVVDHRGTGTTFLSVPAGVRLPFVFGPASASQFRAAGSVPTRAHPGLTHDLDVLSDLDVLDGIPTEELCPFTPSP